MNGTGISLMCGGCIKAATMMFQHAYPLDIRGSKKKSGTHGISHLSGGHILKHIAALKLLSVANDILFYALLLLFYL